MILISSLNDPEIQVRYAAMQAFIKSGASALPDLTPALESSNDEEMRWRAAAALAWIGDSSAIPAIVQASAGADYALKYNGIWGLGQIGDRAAIPALLDIVQADETESPDVRYNAALALLRLGERAYLESAVNSDNEGTYRVAHAALATARWL
ncbi:MAG: HEAT repeat domain-containing protein [Chloroflexi bacterium]|nr:HEAT repeat domain-containing protein [Chloroflexota bacterium]MCC6893350.1 HEAT repeat domain-containing protein [Anaerolineae bacterium]